MSDIDVMDRPFNLEESMFETAGILALIAVVTALISELSILSIISGIGAAVVFVGGVLNKRLIEIRQTLES